MTRTIRRGSLGFDVQVAQGILNLSADGIFGPITDQAVRRFQRSKSLKEDGIVGKNTWTGLHQHAAATRQRFAEDRQRGRIHYNVWLVPQMKDMACWYAAALMVRFWKRELRQACEEGEPTPSEIPATVALYKANTGLGWGQIIIFAKLMGLRTTPRGPVCMGPMFIHDLLKHHGPLWVPLEWAAGGGHVVVITGISEDGATIELNDPWPVGRATKDTKDMLWLNQHVSTAPDRPILWSLGI
jgi:hypothetical protein